MAQLLQNVDIQELLTTEMILNVVKVVVVAIVAFILLRVVVSATRRVLKRRSTAQVTMLVTRAINYTGLALLISFVLLEFGVNLAPILGAAGIVGIAFGIASQASLSSMISGLFLITEKPFAVGDVINTGDTTGIVESIDMLSVKIRTFDNRFVRIPNEKLGSNTLTNITRYPVRRMDFNVTVSYQDDLAFVMETLRQIAAENNLVLRNPAPIVIVSDFTPQGPKVFFGVWFHKTDFLAVKNSVAVEILSRFAGLGITIPVGPVTLQPGQGSNPIPVMITEP